ncbi:hypothetical protein M569_11980, partial [Genlisea aurea]
KLEPFVPKKGHDPRELRSWAKRTGFVSTFSGETGSSFSVTREFDQTTGNNIRNGYGDGLELEKGKNESTRSPKIEIDPVLGRARNRRTEIEPSPGIGSINGGLESGDTSSTNEAAKTSAPEPKRISEDLESGAAANVYGDGEDSGGPGWQQRPSPPRMVLGLKDTPSYGLIVFYGLQHYLSLAGSLIFIPLIIVPAMGGTDKDTSSVMSTMLLLSGITTILNSYFGTRLPLVQGSSFVYLAPALVIINSREFRDITENRFELTMRELQGAIIIGSVFQCIMGFSGLFSLFLRFINPVVVAPTVAAVGLAFFGYGFPQAGACVEISLPMIVLLLFFTLYLGGVSVFGNRAFHIYSVPLSVVIIWTYAFSLTVGGAYNFKGCSPDIPSSNILNDSCRKHVYAMKHCRTDVSDALVTSPWVRIPYPLQWGVPIFRFRTSLIMIFTSLVASIESVGTYHTASMKVGVMTPTPGIVSRGIGMEGFCSLLAGLWGSGTGSTSLMENVHTIAITKVASRNVIVAGSVFIIIFSFIGKIGAILASIPQALAASVLCFIWAMVVALGLSTLHHTQTASFRNMAIVGTSLFLGLSIPAFVQQYLPEAVMMVPSYLVPYSAASDGPIRTGSKEVDFAINGLLSLNMVVSVVMALFLDNTVPGSKEERGVYLWSGYGVEEEEEDGFYDLPRKIGPCF